MGNQKNTTPTTADRIRRKCDQVAELLVAKPLGHRPDRFGEEAGGDSSADG